MADETKVEETTVEETTSTPPVETNEVDYAAELESDIKQFEKAENRKGYEQRVAVKDDIVDEEDDKVVALANKVVERIIPQLQKQSESTGLEVLLGGMTSDPKLRELTKFHYENSVNPSVGSISDRLEAALAIAQRKVIIKKSKELQIADLNRQQMGTIQGSHQESVAKVGDNLLSEAQVRELKQRGWDDKKIERFKANLLKNSNR